MLFVVLHVGIDNDKSHGPVISVDNEMMSVPLNLTETVSLEKVLYITSSQNVFSYYCMCMYMYMYVAIVHVITCISYSLLKNILRILVYPFSPYKCMYMYLSFPIFSLSYMYMYHM